MGAWVQARSRSSSLTPSPASTRSSMSRRCCRQNGHRRPIAIATYIANNINSPSAPPQNVAALLPVAGAAAMLQYMPRCMRDACTMRVRCMREVCAMHAAAYVRCSMSDVCSMCRQCITMHARCMCGAMHNACAMYARCICVACVMYARCICVACVMYARCMCGVCSMHALYTCLLSQYTHVYTHVSRRPVR